MKCYILVVESGQYDDSTSSIEAVFSTAKSAFAALQSANAQLAVTHEKLAAVDAALAMWQECTPCPHSDTTEWDRRYSEKEAELEARFFLSQEERAERYMRSKYYVVEKDLLD